MQKDWCSNCAIRNIENSKNAKEQSSRRAPLNVLRLQGLLMKYSTLDCGQHLPKSNRNNFVLYVKPNQTRRWDDDHQTKALRNSNYNSENKKLLVSATTFFEHHPLERVCKHLY